MWWWKKAGGGHGEARGLMAALLRSRSGNTLAIMAAALVPLIGFSGSAVDIARLYVVKARLQQACDAGVLAGRKTMSDTNPSTAHDDAAAKQAGLFFRNNFQNGWFQNANAVFTPTKATQGTSNVANAVYGTASVQVPMALMQFFGSPTVTETVSCKALYDLADTDVMFVLDTTGSMSCYPSDSDNCATNSAPFTQSNGQPSFYNPDKPQTTDSSGNPMYSKLESLRQAVMLFDTTMRSNADASTHFRYGFVPYNAAVNVGYSIPSGYMQNSTWTYQSRQVSGDYNYGGYYNLANGSQVSGPQAFSLTGIAKNICVPQRYPATGYSVKGPTWGDAGFYLAMNYYSLIWTSANGGTCTGMQQPLRAVWRYQPYTLDISQYVTGAATTNPSRLDGSTSKWRGCIEEVNTTVSSTFDVNNLPHDLDPDFAPSSSTEKWRPMWEDAEWYRNSSASQDVNDEIMAYEDYQDGNGNIAAFSGYGYLYSYDTGHVWDKLGAATCGMAAQRIKTMTAQQVHDYVYHNDFKSHGGTYHDVGMIWGTRMLSPTSVFADSVAWPGRNPPSRSIVFMTDGAMSPSSYVYGQYGLEQFDGRVNGTDMSTDYANHTARFRVECDAAKKKGITIYVVALGTAITSDLTYCASPGQAFQASSTTALTNAFKTIAQRVAKLRISQ